MIWSHSRWLNENYWIEDKQESTIGNSEHLMFDKGIEEMAQEYINDDDSPSNAPSLNISYALIIRINKEWNRHTKECVC